jgi:hypothetical protein
LAVIPCSSPFLFCRNRLALAFHFRRNFSVDAMGAAAQQDLFPEEQDSPMGLDF